MKRSDDFEARREHLKGLSDEQLKARFWELANKLTDPLIQMGYENTTPAIERSVLLRMGFSSLEAKPIVDFCMENNLVQHGAGNVLYRLAKAENISVREAGLGLIEGKYQDKAIALFKEVN